MNFSDDDIDSITDTEENIGTYEGETNSLNQRHGRGKAVLPNNDLYEGEYRNGKRHGRGTYTFVSSGARYIGSYVAGKKDGYGEFLYPDGSRYEGNFSNDVRFGSGVFYYANKDTYEGEWMNDKKHGFGKYVFNNGSVYEGQWRHGQWHGSGEFINADHRYVGMYEKGLPVGDGRYVFNRGYEQLGYYEILSENDAKKNSLGDIEDDRNEDEEGSSVKTVWKPTKLSPIPVEN